MNRFRRESIGVAAWLLLAGCGAAPPAPSDSAVPAEGPRVVLPDGFVVAVEIAADPETRARGLMYRPHLPPDRGMLFLFPSTEIQSFWMKDTLIPLDLIWIDEGKRIVDIRADVPPCPADPCPSYSPEAEAKYVLEIAGGEAVRHGLARGQHLVFHAVEQYIVR